MGDNEERTKVEDIDGRSFEEDVKGYVMVTFRPSMLWRGSLDYDSVAYKT